MKKRTYKAMQNKCARTIARELFTARENVREAVEAKEAAIIEKDKAVDKAEWYVERFRKLGSKFDTIPADPYAVVEWEADPEQYGTFMAFCDNIVPESEMFQRVRREIVTKIVNGLLEQNLVQFIYRDRAYDPLSCLPTLGAKLYVLPWDQVPYRNKIRLTTWMYNERVVWGDKGFER